MLASRKLPYKLTQQKIFLDVDLFAQKLTGHVQLTFIPTGEKKFTEISLNLQQAYVSSVAVNGAYVQFQQKNYVDAVVPSSFATYTDPESFKTFYKADLQASENGELVFEVPQQDNMELEGQVGNQQAVVVKIDYTVLNPRGGVSFVLPSPALPKRRAHAFTHNSVHGARMWMPCLDCFTERPTWEMTYTVPKDLVVISTGELFSKMNFGEKTSYQFVHNVPTCASSILFAVGPFESIEEKYGDVTVTNYVLPGRKKLIENSTKFLSQVFQFLNGYLKIGYPYSSYKQVFVEENYSNFYSGATMSVLSSKLLYPFEIIDQTFQTRWILTLAVASQWFGNFVSVKTWSDAWLQFGLTGFLSLVFYQKMFGHNEYLFKLMNYMDYVCSSPYNQPLYSTEFITPHELFHPLFYKKATLVIYLVERHVGTDGFKKVLANILSPQKSKDKPLDSCLSTPSFLKQIKKITGFEMKAFANKWIYTTGCPKFIGGFYFNKIKKQTEIAFKQDLTPREALLGKTLTPEKMNGVLTCRIVEIDGDDHQFSDHPLIFDDVVHVFDIPMQNRSSRSRNRGNKMTVPKPDEGTTTISGPFASSELASMLSSPIQWLRFDPQMQWIMKLSFSQPQAMWIKQLKYDNDIRSQLHAIQNLKFFPSKATIEALLGVFTSQQFFYRVRTRAAYMIASLSGPANEWVGLEGLLKFFKDTFFNRELDGTRVIRPNNFEDFLHYYLQKCISHALSLVKDHLGITPDLVFHFVIHLIQNHENAGNDYADCYYFGNLIRSLGNMNINNDKGIKLVKKIILRNLASEKVVPCYHNIISVACLKTYSQLMVRKKIPVDLSTFLNYTIYGNALPVRIAAIRALVSLGVNQPISKDSPKTVLEYLIELMRNEPLSCAYMRYKIIALLLEVHPCDCEWDSDAPELTIGNRGESSRDSILKTRFSSFVIVRYVQLRETIWDLLNSYETSCDGRVRSELVQLHHYIGGKTFAQKSLPPRAQIPSLPPSKVSQESKKRRNDIKEDPSNKKSKLSIKIPSEGKEVPVKHERSTTKIKIQLDSNHDRKSPRPEKESRRSPRPERERREKDWSPRDEFRDRDRDWERDRSPRHEREGRRSPRAERPAKLKISLPQPTLTPVEEVVQKTERPERSTSSKFRIPIPTQPEKPTVQVKLEPTTKPVDAPVVRPTLKFKLPPQPPTPTTKSVDAPVIETQPEKPKETNNKPAKLRITIPPAKVTEEPKKKEEISPRAQKPSKPAEPEQQKKTIVRFKPKEPAKQALFPNLKRINFIFPEPEIKTEVPEVRAEATKMKIKISFKPPVANTK